MGRDAGPATETAPGPRVKTCHRCFSCCVSQATPVAARRSGNTCYLPRDNRLRRRKEPNFPPAQYLLPKHLSQPCGFFPSPPVGPSSPHPQAARWFPGRTRGCEIAWPAVRLHGWLLPFGQSTSALGEKGMVNAKDILPWASS